MNNDTIVMKSDIVLTDNNGDKIDVKVCAPELLEIWV